MRAQQTSIWCGGEEEEEGRREEEKGRGGEEKRERKRDGTENEIEEGVERRA